MAISRQQNNLISIAVKADRYAADVNYKINKLENEIEELRKIHDFCEKLHNEAINMVNGTIQPDVRAVSKKLKNLMTII